MSCWTQIHLVFANSVDPDQLANWSGSALFGIKYMNLYQQPGSSYLIGCGISISSAWQGLNAPVFSFSSADLPFHPRHQYRYFCKQCILQWAVSSGSTLPQSVMIFWLKSSICNNGCVQIQRWKSPCQRVGGERATYCCQCELFFQKKILSYLEKIMFHAY